MTQISPVVLPAGPLTGGCQCSAVRYRLTGVPLTYYLCHCTICQRQSGSAFGESLQMRAGDVEISGETVVHAYEGGSGTTVEARFCPRCHVRLTHRRADSEVAVIKAGTLDRRDWLRPAGHIFAATAQPWMPLDDTVALVDADRPDMARLHDRWQLMLQAGNPCAEHDIEETDR
ncbi:GFA family protein [Mesobaculum littorinae]|uniref:GFA family protein n=1 Tax=Mesobaculum littorinae TaxID=2486419 RepID=A0A438AHL8_9RHOB|nr:GFA family protein [Mesobaculum littorinae]RVV98115.1 GFA family protein [Mesobaculum littorinae]